jgi:hypothetical protein
MRPLTLSVCLAVLLALSTAVTFAGKSASIAAASGLPAQSQCEANGYQQYMRSDGTRFKNAGACASYAARNQPLYRVPALAVAPPVLPSCQYASGYPDTVYLSQCTSINTGTGATCTLSHEAPSDTFPLGRDILQGCSFAVSGTGLQPNSTVVASLSLCQFAQCPYSETEILGTTDARGSFSSSFPFNICFKDNGSYVLSGTVTATTDIGTTIAADLPIADATGMILGPDQAKTLLLCR